MKPARPSGTENATAAQTAAFFQTTRRTFNRAVRKGAIKAYVIGGDERFGEDHIVCIAGCLGRADEELALRRAWREFCELPLLTNAEVKTMLAQHRNLLASVNHLEQLVMNFRHGDFANLVTQVNTLQAARKSKRIDERLLKLETERKAA